MRTLHFIRLKHNLDFQKLPQPQESDQVLILVVIITLSFLFLMLPYLNSKIILLKCLKIVATKKFFTKNTYIFMNLKIN